MALRVSCTIPGKPKTTNKSSGGVAYMIDGEPTEWKMRMASIKLREHFTENTVQEFRVLVQINGEHKGHLVGELSGYGLPLHAEVKTTMKELVDDGITKVSEIERHLHRDNGDVPLTNRRFFALPQDIRNHVSQALKKKRKIYTKHGRIIGMEDENMKKIFLEDRFLEYVYLLHVLVTEGLTAILQHCTGLSYKEADEECRAVEGSSDSFKSWNYYECRKKETVRREVKTHERVLGRNFGLVKKWEVHNNRNKNVTGLV